MPWIRFLRDFDFMHPSGRAVTAYKKDTELLVPQKARDRAIEVNAAEDINDPTEARKQSKKKKA